MSAFMLPTSAQHVDKAAPVKRKNRATHVLHYSVFAFATWLWHGIPVYAASLTWEDAIQRTLKENPSLKAFGYQHAVHAGRVTQAGVSPPPELSLTVEDALGTGPYKGVDSTETTLSIGWVTENTLKQRRIEAAQSRAASVNVEEDLHRLDAAAQTARLYLEVSAYQTRLIHAENALRSAENVLKILQQRIDAGIAPTAEAARAQADLARRALEREDVEHSLLVAKHRLAAQWGARTPTFSHVAGNVLVLPKTEPFASLKARIQQNPVLARFASAQRVYQSELALTQAKTRPLWQFSAGIKHLAASDDQALVAGISIPLGTADRYQGRRAETQANVDRNNIEREAEQLRIETALFALHQELNHSLHVAQAYTTDIIPRLESAWQETRRAYDMGRYSYLEWQSVQQELLAAKNIVIDASVEAHLNAIEIERLTGVSATPAALSP